MEKKEKVGILTFHNAHNYGAALQAYALRTKLRSMGYETEIINYCNKAISKNYRKVLRPYLWKRDILPQNWGKVFREIRKCLYAGKVWKRQWMAFSEFKNHVLLEDKIEQISKKDLETSDYDVFMLGSDQIWASELTRGLDPVYFGNFGTGKRKVSYAASVPNASIPEREKDAFRIYLKNIDYISVREEKLADAVSELTGRDVKTVVDPTLLLEVEDYENLIKDSFISEKRYVFAYFVVESDELLKCAQQVALSLGVELIELHYYKMPNQKGRNVVADIGPHEFLAYIKNAQFVLTNSFHGTVFSILFQKRFYSVYNKNGRIDNLLEFLDISDRHISSEKDIDIEKEINYEQTRNLLKKYRSESISFLEEALR